MPRHDKVKVNRANEQTGGKNRSNTFVLTALISFGLFKVFLFCWGYNGKKSLRKVNSPYLDHSFKDGVRNIAGFHKNSTLLLDM